MLGRTLVAALVVAVAFAPLASAPAHVTTPGQDSQDAGVQCPDRIHGEAGPQAGQEPVASATVESGDDCGVRYDHSEGTLYVSPSFERAEVALADWIYRLGGPHSLDDAEDGIGHGADWLLGETQAKLAGALPVAGTQNGEQVWMDEEGLHVFAHGQHQTVPWVEVLGYQPVDEENVYAPTEVHTSSTELLQRIVEVLREQTASEADPVWEAWEAAGIVEAAPEVVLHYHVGDVDARDPAPSFGLADPTERTGRALPAGTPSQAASSTDDATATSDDRGAGDGVATQLAETIRRPLQRPSVGAVMAAAVAAAILAVIVGYRRLTSGKVLENTIRARIFEHIKEHPGVTTQEIADALEVDYSTASHHVGVLKEFDLVHSRKQGRITHFFENHGTYGNFEKDAIPLLREGTSSEVARLVRDNPGIRPAAVARSLDVDPSTVKWHVDKLKDADLVDAEPLDGRSVGLMVPEKARDVVDRWT